MEEDQDQQIEGVTFGWILSSTASLVQCCGFDKAEEKRIIALDAQVLEESD